MDNDIDNDNDSDEEQNGVDLTGFLFGNIDSSGRLEDDIFDSESKKHLASLSRFGLNSLLHEVILEGDNRRGRSRSPTSETDSNDADDEKEDDRDYSKKDDTAIDYSDINELADELPNSIQPPNNEYSYKSDDDYDLEDSIPANQVKLENDSGSLNRHSNDDKTLMPPPSLPIKTSGQDTSGKSSSDLTSSDSEAEKDKKQIKKKLDTPLATMLPSKYENVDVRELFPDFRPDKVLRFSRLFGPGKPSSLPQIWRSVRKRKRKRKGSRENRHRDGSDSTSDTEEPRRNRGWTFNYAEDPLKEYFASDDEDKLLKETIDDAEEKPQELNESGEAKPKVADWRFGPAQVWYDMLEVPESGEGFNYGFKIKDKDKVYEDDEIVIKGNPITDDAYLMVSQLHWEDDVVWDGNDIKQKVIQKLNSKTNAAGWLPSSGSRTAGAFSQPGKGLPVTPTLTGSKLPNPPLPGKLTKSQMILQKIEEHDDTWYSIFPVENEELVYSKWEEEVIWDAEFMSKVPKPKVLTLDPNDENIILGIPDDIDPSKIHQNTGPTPKVKIPHPHVKKSKILLGKAGVINVLAEDTPPPPPKSPDRDPFNISNDVFYMAKSSETTLRMKVGGGNLIQHSTPVIELRAPFVPTHMGPMKLRMFHRIPMKKYSHGPIAGSGPHSVLPLVKNIKKKARQRELERIASGGGDVFFMRNPEDLSGRDGEIILIEFCEEHPPLMNQVGMCSKIKNYYKRKAGKDSGPPEFKFGEVAYAHTSPFLGILHPGHYIQAVENIMYRAPIYPHAIPPTDFLVIRTRNSFFIREIDALFTAGQECPLYEVPGPNSKRANNFVRDFLQVFIYRLFWKSRDNPRRIRMDDIKRAFPGHSESSIRKRLKQCADFKRTGLDSNWWVIKPEFRLPSEEELRAMVSPEQCCAYFSMIAAEQRLKDAGYGEKFIFAQQEDDDEEMQLKMDDEVKVAPWNTTRAYIQAMRGKCLLQLTGPADPTGCGEGFSYVRVPNKPTQTKKEQESQPKTLVHGTDADLRKLSLNNAKALLRKYQVPEEEIKKLSRWEVIDVVRTLSTEKAKAGEEGMDKFSRGNRFSIAEHQERYKEECQRIFDLQNRVLASAEVLSTDEGESTASEESDLEELGKNLENMLANKKTSTQLSLEREEQERQELLKKFMEEREGTKPNKKKDDDGQNSNANAPPQAKILKITRTFKNAEGKEYTRVEIVRKQQIIDAYVKIRTTKDEAFIKQFATLDEAQKEEMKREKRRIQEQLRRIKRNQEKVGMLNQQHTLPGGPPICIGDRGSNSSQSTNLKLTIGGVQTPGTPGTPLSSKDVSPSRRRIKLKPDLKLKCGACGQVGHMRTNKACPLYAGTFGPSPSLNVAMTEEQEEEIEKELNADDEDLVNVDGTKVKLSGKLLKRHEDVKRRTLLIKVPKDAVSRKRRRVGGDMHCDYLKRHNKPANRRRTDPVVVLSSILEQILNEMRDMIDVQPFLFPVNGKLVPDYYRIVIRPMDLQTIREYLRQKRYQSREEFLADVNQIVENSTLYNGPKSILTLAAQRMLQKCIERLSEKEERLMRLEKAINPLLDDDDQVALSFIFEKLINGKLKVMTESWPFLKPVNKKTVKDYYTVIRRPMDLETITKKVTAHKYHSRIEFLSDIELIASNCEQYNGCDSTFTKQAKIIVEYAIKALEEFGDHCAHLERNIALVQERARDEAELDGGWGDEHDEHDDVHLHRSSRHSSPDNDFVDVENPERPLSSASTSSQNQKNLGPTIIPAMPEIKRGRGRPRKFREQTTPSGDDAKFWSMKRGRGRPRKDSFNSNLSSTQNSYLEEDLQFSTDDEEFEDVASDNDGVAATLLDQGERLAHNSSGGRNSENAGGSVSRQETTRDSLGGKSQNIGGVGGVGHGDDDSQQAAEAMVQLSGIGFYTAQQTQEDTMDLDPNYDPSDFLGGLQPNRQNQLPQPDQQYNNEELSIQQINTSENTGELSSVDDLNQEQNIGIHDDLAISDSDEEQNLTMDDEVPKQQDNDNDNENDEHDLWF